MAGVNKVILLGHLGKDPEIRAMETGRKVANFTLATSETYKDKNGERVESTEWHNVVFWGPVTEVIEKYVKKGTQIYVEGKLRTRSYEKDGVKKYSTEILGDTLTLLGGGNKNSEGASGNATSGYTAPAATKSVVEDRFEKASMDDSDDLPF